MMKVPLITDSEILRAMVNRQDVIQLILGDYKGLYKIRVTCFPLEIRPGVGFCIWTEDGIEIPDKIDVDGYRITVTRCVRKKQ